MLGLNVLSLLVLLDECYFVLNVLFGVDDTLFVEFLFVSYHLQEIVFHFTHLFVSLQFPILLSSVHQPHFLLHIFLILYYIFFIGRPFLLQSLFHLVFECCDGILVVRFCLYVLLGYLVDLLEKFEFVVAELIGDVSFGVIDGLLDGLVHNLLRRLPLFG